MRILVIGGGIAGTTTAYFLTAEGHEVTVVDRAQALAAEGSFANGGMLHASHTAPWNSPAAARQILQWIGRRDSPLRLRPGQIPHLLGWGFGFLRYSRPRHFQRSFRVSARLAVYSQRTLAALREETGLTYDEGRRGIVKLFRTPAALEAARRFAPFLEEWGVRERLLDVPALIELEPMLSGIKGALAGGAYYPDDETGDACLFTRRLGELAAALGTNFRFGTTVRAIECDRRGVRRLVTDKGELEADVYVLAAGAEAPRLAHRLGLHLPIRPVKGYSATLPVAGLAGVPRMPLIDDEQKLVISVLGERLRVAGLAEFAGYNTAVNERRVESLLQKALANLPELAAGVDARSASHWACLRPMTVDGPPILGRSPVPNLYLNIGGGHLGWTLGAGSARAVADIVCGRTPAIDMDGLTYNRFHRPPRH